MRASSRCHFTIYLDAAEMFQMDTPTGRIHVRMLSGDIYPKFEAGSVTTRGFAIKKDGTQGAIQRDGKIKVMDLPVGIRYNVIREIRNEAKRYAVE